MERYPTRHFRILRGGLLREGYGCGKDSLFLTYGGHEILRENERRQAGVQGSYLWR